MKKWMVSVASLALLAASGVVPWARVSASEARILEKYDHDFHERKVFTPNAIQCSHCHNLALSAGKWEPLAALEASTFARPVREICHECHQGSRAEFSNAPKSCTTCHRTLEALRQIKPQNHGGVDWARSHAANARANAESCTTCHSNSQCVKCHASRNEVIMVNHSRNFRFIHSIEARAQPQRCDTCHSKDYCTRCHLGGGR